jgi:multicomponent Na+:H+ antiporter subunit D
VSNIIANLPAIQIVLPLLAIAICILLPSRNNKIWLFPALISFVSLLVSIKLFLLSSQQEIMYNFGGWKAPIGIEYKINIFNSLFLIIISFSAFVSILFSYKIVKRDIDQRQQNKFYAVFLACFTGMLGIVLTNDLFNAYVFIEISSLASYALVAMGTKKEASFSSFQYLIFGTIGATFYLMGVGLVYMMTGSLNITDLSLLLPQIIESPVTEVGLAFLVLGLLFKIGVYPLHVWLPNVYSNSPSLVSSFFSGASSKVMICLLIKILYCLFGYSLISNIYYIKPMLLLFATLSIIIGGASCLLQKQFNKLLAFSSISQIGFIVLAISFFTNEFIICYQH